MDVCLVSLIGKGNLSKNKEVEDVKGGYKKTTYIFPDRKIDSCVFTEALIEYYKSLLKKVVIIGTDESFWNALLPDPYENDCILWDEIEENRSNNSISHSTLLKLEGRLSEYYKCSFKLLCHPKDISNSEESITATYSQIFSNLEEGTKTIFDITSGYRYMPMLAFQELQLHDSFLGFDNVTMLYGEYGDELSYVRDITGVWKREIINKEIHTFKTTLNGEYLSKILSKYGENEISDWIEKLTEYIQKDYLLLCDDVFFRRLKNILKKKKGIVTTESFINEVVAFLSDLCSKFDFSQKRISSYLFVFSKILYETGNHTQAIIALKESVRARLSENHNHEDLYEFVKAEDLKKKDYYHDFERECSLKSVLSQINELNNLRNSIAHAGADQKKECKKTFKYSFVDYYKAAEVVFKEIEL